MRNKKPTPTLQARAKQFHASLEFCDPDAGYKTKLDCQLDTGATCNFLIHRVLSVIFQNGHPAIKNTKVKLQLFNGNVMKPLEEVTLNVDREGQEPHFLKFQVVEGKSKPLLSAETCENFELLKINCESTPQVNSMSEVKPLLTKEKILQD